MKILSKKEQKQTEIELIDFCYENTSSWGYDRLKGERVSGGIYFLLESESFFLPRENVTDFFSDIKNLTPDEEGDLDWDKFWGVYHDFNLGCLPRF